MQLHVLNAAGGLGGIMSPSVGSGKISTFSFKFDLKSQVLGTIIADTTEKQTKMNK